MNRKKLIQLLLGIFCAINCSAQSIGPATLNSAGGAGNIGANTYEYSIGEMTLVNTASSPTITITQGILQPASNSTSIGSTPIAQYHLNVFPNPASDFVNIETNIANAGGTMQLWLTDMAGKTIMKSTHQISSGKVTTALKISELANGTYLLNVRFEGKNDQFNEIFKIQKSQ